MAIGLGLRPAIIAMVYALGRISGGHFNPAVSVGAAIGGRMSWREPASTSAPSSSAPIVGGSC